MTPAITTHITNAWGLTFVYMGQSAWRFKGFFPPLCPASVVSMVPCVALVFLVRGPVPLLALSAGSHAFVVH